MQKYLMMILAVLSLLVVSVAYSAMFFELNNAVKNERVRQDGNRIVFEYDLEGDNEADVSVTLTIDGKKYQVKDLHLEGDYGKVMPGKNKMVYWNVLLDFPRGLHGEFDADIVASGGDIEKPAFKRPDTYKWSPNILNDEKVSYGVRDYYNNKGEWAGIFIIDRIEKIRIENKSDSEAVAHVLYWYKPAPIQKRRDNRTGSDKRTFTLYRSSKNSSWEVIKMGGYNSGRP